MSHRTCPKCNRVYPEDAQICEDCDQALVEASEDAQTNGDLVPLTTVSGPEEGAVLKNVLESEGIRALVEDPSLILGGVMRRKPAEVRVLVNSEDAEAALEILESHRRGELTLSEDELPETDESAD